MILELVVGFFSTIIGLALWISLGWLIGQKVGPYYHSTSEKTINGMLIIPATIMILFLLLLLFLMVGKVILLTMPSGPH